MAAESVQPVPCVFFVRMRGALERGEIFTVEKKIHRRTFAGGRL